MKFWGKLRKNEDGLRYRNKYTFKHIFTKYVHLGLSNELSKLLVVASFDLLVITYSCYLVMGKVIHEVSFLLIEDFLCFYIFFSTESREGEGNRVGV